jgi:uncharacterized protein
VKALREV